MSDDAKGATVGDEELAMRAALIDGRDALFGLVVREARTGGDRVEVETFGAGMSKREASLLLRDVAAALDAEGDGPA